VLLLGPGNKKIKSLADLKKIKKIALLGDGDNNIALIRNILDIGEGTGAAARRP
jgi:soluble P-type ATPase